MSLKSWRKEFYPIPASKVSKSKAIEHSLQKWIGLREKNLEKHNLEHVGLKRIAEWEDITNSFSADNESCALCVFYFDANAKCDKCPLSKLRKRYPCDEEMDDETDSPYISFIQHKRPEPMIKLLRQALKQQQKEEKK